MRPTSIARVPLRVWPLLARVVLTWALLEVGLRTFRLPKVAEAFGVPLALQVRGAPESPATPPVWTERELRRMAWALKLLRRRPFDGTCLRRSLVVGHLIRRRQPRLCLGAKKTAGRVSAHAWLEIAGAFIDVEDPDSFMSEDWRRF